MTTQANTISFGATPAPSASDVEAKNIQVETVAINNLLNTHKVETNNLTNSFEGYGKGLKAFMKAVDLILKINKDWAYELLWQYYVDNKDGSCKEEAAFRGAMVVKDDLGRYVAIANLLRHYTMNYSSNVSENAYVQQTGNANIVLWVEKKAGI